MQPIIKKLYELYKRKKEIRVDLKGFLEPITAIFKQQSLAYTDEYRKKIDDHTPFRRHRDVKYWLDEFSKVNRELGQYEDEHGDTIIVETRLAAVTEYDTEIVEAYRRLMGFVAREQEVIQELDDAIAEIMAREDWDKWITQLHEYYTLIQILNQDIKLFTLLLRKIWQKHLLDEVVSEGYEKLKSAGRLNVIAINLEKMLGFGDGYMLKVAVSYGFDVMLVPFTVYGHFEGNPCTGIGFYYYSATGEIYRFVNTWREEQIERKNLVFGRFIVAVDFKKKNPYYKIVNLEDERENVQRFDGRDLASSNLRKSILLYNERAQSDASDEFFAGVSSAIEGTKSMAERQQSATFDFEVGVYETQGRMPTMEDTHFHEKNFGEKEGCLFAGIYDGHNGKGFSKFASEKIHELFLEILKKTRNEAGAFQAAYFFLSGVLTGSGKDGTCAVNIYIDGDKLFIAHAGNSRALLCLDKSLLFFTADHDSLNEKERDRVKSEGGSFAGRFLNGKIAVTRSLGDGTYVGDGLSNVPEQNSFSLSNVVGKGVIRIIMCSHGLFGVDLTNEQVGEIVNRYGDPQDSAKTLVDTAVEKGSRENITVMVIKLIPKAGTQTTAVPVTRTEPPAHGLVVGDVPVAGNTRTAIDTPTFFSNLFAALRDERFDDAERIIISAIGQLTTPQRILDVYELAFLRGLVVVHIKNHNFEQAAINLNSENINQFDFGPGIVDELKRIVEELRRRHPGESKPVTVPTSIILLTQRLEQCAVGIRQLHERTPDYNRILNPAKMDLLEIGGSIPNLLKKIPGGLEKYGITYFAHYEVGQLLNGLFRLRAFIEGYCSKLEMETTKRLYEDGRGLIGSMAELFQTLQNLGMNFDNPKFLHRAPDDFRQVEAPVPPLIFRSEELLIPITKLALAKPEYFSYTVLDVDSLGYTYYGERIKTSGWICYESKWAPDIISNSLSRTRNSSLIAEFRRLLHGGSN